MWEREKKRRRERFVWGLGGAGPLVVKIGKTKKRQVPFASGSEREKKKRDRYVWTLRPAKGEGRNEVPSVKKKGRGGGSGPNLSSL